MRDDEDLRRCLRFLGSWDELSGDERWAQEVVTGPLATASCIFCYRGSYLSPGYRPVPHPPHTLSRLPSCAKFLATQTFAQDHLPERGVHTLWEVLTWSQDQAGPGICHPHVTSGELFLLSSLRVPRLMRSGQAGG